MGFPATIAEADDYLSTERAGTDAWFASGVDKQVYLNQAFNRLNRDPDYSIPDSPDDDQEERLEEAHIELAFSILTTVADLMRPFLKAVNFITNIKRDQENII